MRNGLCATPSGDTFYVVRQHMGVRFYVYRGIDSSIRRVVRIIPCARWRGGRPCRVGGLAPDEVYHPMISLHLDVELSLNALVYTAS